MADGYQPTSTGEASLVAATERQAMDWSLVLLSQGIEPTLRRDDATGSWQLMVPPSQAAAGRQSIRLYERENRAWPLRHPLPWPGFAFDWTVLAWAALIGAFFVLQERPGSVLEAAGLCDTVRIRAGEWWRLLTATLLHADFAHMAGNAVFGVLLLGLVMGRFGAGVGLLAAHLAGAAANAFALLGRSDTIRSLGASGVVLSALGLLAVDTAVQCYRHQQPRRLVLGSVIGGLMLFLQLGTAPNSDVAAHLGGFLGGLLLGVPLALTPVTRVRNPPLNWLAGVLLAGLIVGAWWLALRKGLGADG